MIAKTEDFMRKGTGSSCVGDENREEGKKGNKEQDGQLSLIPDGLILGCNNKMLADLNDRNLFSHSCGAWKSKVRKPIASVPGEGFLLGLDGHLV